MIPTFAWLKNSVRKKPHEMPWQNLSPICFFLIKKKQDIFVLYKYLRLFKDAQTHC